MECVSRLNDDLTLSRIFKEKKFYDFCIQSSKQAWIDFGNGWEPLSFSWDENEYKKWCLEWLSHSKKTWNAERPFLDGIYDDVRFHMVFPPVYSSSISCSFRNLSFRKTKQDLPLREKWGLDEKTEKIILEILQRKETILLSGATGSGKTTLLNDLLSLLPEQERVIALEDTLELQPQHKHFLSLEIRSANSDGYGEIDSQILLKQILRMKPDRIVLGECRSQEVLELLQALNTGHEGSLFTIHANHCRDALRRVETLAMLHQTSMISEKSIKKLISAGIQWLIHVKNTHPKRKIMEITRLEGLEGDTILTRQIYLSKDCAQRKDHLS